MAQGPRKLVADGVNISRQHIEQNQPHRIREKCNPAQQRCSKEKKTETGQCGQQADGEYPFLIAGPFQTIAYDRICDARRGNGDDKIA